MAENPKKKILFILPALGAGGAERVLITYMNHINTKRYAPVFLAFNETGQARRWIKKTIPFHSFGRRSVKGSLFKLIAFVKKEKPDVIMTTMVHCNAAALIVKILFPGIKVIIRESSLPDALIKQYGWKGHACVYIYKYLYPLADLVLSPSNLIPEQFRRTLNLDTKRHAVLYNPVDTAQINKALPDHFDCPPDRAQTVYFGFVGRLAYEKGLDRLFDALESWRPPFKWRLDILGDGGEYNALKKQIKALGLEHNIFLHGHQDRPWNILAQSDCVLLPSRWEGMPNAVLEGLAVGLPAIAHRQAGAIEEIAAAAEPGDVQIAENMDDFVQKMTSLQPQPKTKPAPSRLPQEFSLDHLVSIFESYLATPVTTRSK